VENINVKYKHHISHSHISNLTITKVFISYYRKILAKNYHSTKQTNENAPSVIPTTQNSSSPKANTVPPTTTKSNNQPNLSHKSTMTTSMWEGQPSQPQPMAISTPKIS
jgi:hypothetical protein